MTLAANLLNAVGGTPDIGKPGFIPRYPSYLPHSAEAFLVPLAPFSPAAIETFMLIEKPAEVDGEAEADRYDTIGQFYRAIEDGLKALCESLGEKTGLLRRPGAAGQARDARLLRRRAHRRGGRPRVGAGRDRRNRGAGRGAEARRGVGRRSRHVPSGTRRGRALLPLRGDRDGAAPTSVATRRPRDRPAPGSRWTGAPSIRCVPTRGRRTFMAAARSSRSLARSTSSIRTCSAICIAPSMASRDGCSARCRPCCS